MLKQAQVDHYRFQHQLTGKMSCAWKHEAFGAGVSKNIIRPKHTHAESAATPSTSDSEVCRLLSTSLPQDTIHHKTRTAARTDLIALSKGWVTTVCAAVTS